MKNDSEVAEPIICPPYDPPSAHWHIVEGEPPEKRPGRRPAEYTHIEPGRMREGDYSGTRIELKLINRVRQRLEEWRKAGRPGITRTTHDLLQHWTSEGRLHRLFFAQLEAAETIIFLTEARPDMLQGIDVPMDKPDPNGKKGDFSVFRRYACKMATGTGKTTVMGMLAAWSILNKQAIPSDKRFSDTVLIVCPNVTIRRRLEELDPRRGEASLYRTRDLVPPHLTSTLNRGRVLIVNWHFFEPKGRKIGGASGRVVKTGTKIVLKERIILGRKTTSRHGKHYMTPVELDQQINAGLLSVIDEERDDQGNRIAVTAKIPRWVESDSGVVDRVLKHDIGNKRNILVFNDEAHHAYRLLQNDPELDEPNADEEDMDEYFVREATVWVEGLDKIHAKRHINFCVDLSATPYFLGRAGQDTNRIFPWTVSEFGLTDAIESGLVKVPQLVAQDSSGASVPGYFNIWRWVLERLTPRERGGRKGSPKPEAVLKHVNTPILMLAGLWDEMRQAWEARDDEKRPPVFILVCKNTQIAKVVYEWISGESAPSGIMPSPIDALKNTNGHNFTIRVDTKVVQETDMGSSKSDETAWMRLMLDTIGKLEWPRDSHSQGREIYPEGFAELAKKLNRPFHPPGRDVRCIVSVGMLTEGWDCQTVTHIMGLRPFSSQLLCEQVVGRGLRRTNYEIGSDDLMVEEVAKIFGVPFERIPLKSSGSTEKDPRKSHRIYAIPEKQRFEITFPRLERYAQTIQGAIAVDFESIASLALDPIKIPTEARMKALFPASRGRPALSGPGDTENVSLEQVRRMVRMQKCVFAATADIVMKYRKDKKCGIGAHILFPQVAKIVQRYIDEKIRAHASAEKVDVFLGSDYENMIDHLFQAIGPDTESGESPEIAILERHRSTGSTHEVDFVTRRDVWEVEKSHLNYAVADTKKWEQSAAYVLDTHDAVQAFAKNEGMGFAIPYLHDGEMHDFRPDFIIRLNGQCERHLILETKGFDILAGVKNQAAQRWVSAVNASGKCGQWNFLMIRDVKVLREKLNEHI